MDQFQLTYFPEATLWQDLSGLNLGSCNPEVVMQRKFQHNEQGIVHENIGMKANSLSPVSHVEYFHVLSL